MQTKELHLKEFSKIKKKVFFWEGFLSSLIKKIPITYGLYFENRDNVDGWSGD